VGDFLVFPLWPGLVVGFGTVALVSYAVLALSTTDVDNKYGYPCRKHVCRLNSTQLNEHVRTQVLIPQCPHLFNTTIYETTHAKFIIILGDGLVIIYHCLICLKNIK